MIISSVKVQFIKNNMNLLQIYLYDYQFEILFDLIDFKPYKCKKIVVTFYNSFGFDKYLYIHLLKIYNYVRFY